jgi:hypothetical protein
MKIAERRLLGAVAISLALAACSAHPVRVSCRSHLTPINPPVTLPRDLSGAQTRGTSKNPGSSQPKAEPPHGR